MPQRFLRPGIRTSERWNAVCRDAQALYIALLTLVDDYGRYDARFSVLWADAFAVWNEMNPELAVIPQRIPALCCQLADKKLVEFYEKDGKKFLQLSQWQERARGKSRWPEPSDSKILRNPAECCQNPASLAIAISPSHEPSPEDKKASEINPRFIRPTIEEVRLASGKSGLPESEVFKFFNYYESNGWRVGKNPMKSLGGAIGSWAARWREQGGQSANGHTTHLHQGHPTVFKRSPEEPQ